MMVMPKYITLKNWAGSLNIDYPNDILPILRNEEEWEEWATIVANTGSFKNAAIPTPTSLKKEQNNNEPSNWNEWAKIVYYIMNS
jgi:hypothetical protein